jgi:ribosomal protein L12E/L44/L45/RPP1/RPP2
LCARVAQEVVGLDPIHVLKQLTIRSFARVVNSGAEQTGAPSRSSHSTLRLEFEENRNGQEEDEEEELEEEDREEEEQVILL